VDRILDLVEEAVFQLRDMAAGQRGQVRIGASFPITPPSPVYYYQYEFFHSHPQVALFLHVHSGGRIETMLEERELDFGISLAPATHFGIASQPLYTDKLGIIVGPNHPLAEKKQVALKELKDERFSAIPPHQTPMILPTISADWRDLSRKSSMRESPRS
jgi:LysR family cyn operon transcriptional activator